MDRLKGFEVLHALIKDQLRSKQDCLVAVVHSLLINEGLVCVGTGDVHETENETELGTELLPDDWNSNQEIYTLRYTDRDLISRYLLKIVTAGDTLIVNVLKDEDNVAVMSISIDNHVTDDYREFSRAFQDLSHVVSDFETDVLYKLKEKDVNTGSSSPKPEGGPSSLVLSDDGIDDMEDEPLINHPPFRPPPPRPRGSITPEVGSADLNPFSGGRGGGMFVDPGSLGVPARPTMPQFGVGGPGGLPRGAVPPGARFYPVRPPARGRGMFRLDPDRDDLPPPNFDDFEDL